MPVYNGTAAGESLSGTIYDDYISGFAGNDSLYGDQGNDFLYGGFGDDELGDGAGLDWLYGQAGDDWFNLDSAAESDFVDGGAGHDIVVYLTPVGTTTVVDMLYSSVNAGAAAGDRLVSIEGFLGGEGRDNVRGTNGDNLFYASAGNDNYYGRDGLDTYWARSGGTATTVTFEVGFGTRATELAAAAGIAAPAAGSAVGYYEIWNDANMNGIREASEVERHADVLTSVEGFIGTGWNDRLVGSAADEVFAPMTGTDTVNGGGGFDYIAFEPLGLLHGNALIVDLQAGIATLGDGGSVNTSISQIEGIMGSVGIDQLQGNSVRNVMFGDMGDDALDGRGGNDELYGEQGRDILIGGDGNDILSGGLEADTIDGGAGVDTLSYAAATSGGSNAGIAVSLLRGSGGSPIIQQGTIFNPISDGDSVLNVENVVGSLYDDTIGGDDNANVLEGRMGTDTIDGCGGDDVIYGESAPGSVVADYVHEHELTDTGTFDIHEDCGCEELDDEGHDVPEQFNDFLFGSDGADRIYGQLGDDELCGGNGADTLSGASGNDILEGDADNDVLDGGLGTDFLYGGSGNDRISGGPGFDIIFGGSGVDAVDYSTSSAGVTVNLGEYWLNSGGDAATDYLTEIMDELAAGQDPALVLQSALFLSLLQSLGSDGSEQSFTLSIPDVILGVESAIGSAFNDSLTGDAFNNNLYGQGGNDRLDGGGGNDYMNGSNGNDLYIVDSVFDRAIETSSTGGTDRVESSVTFTLSTNVESLTLTGTAAINGTGNSGANTLTGNAAANVLNGAGGADRMIGLGGDDTYQVDNAGDVVVEGSLSGTDRVLSAISYTLGTNLENLTLIGSSAINGAGNSVANVLIGNAAANTLRGHAGNDVISGASGNDRLIGGAGSDSLNGGAGQDRFIFESALSATTNVDTISGFSAADDTIELLQSIFSGLGTGTLSASAFRAGAAAADSDDRIIYNSATGQIFYDADGSGGGGQVLFARVGSGTSLTAADFVVVSSVAAAAAPAGAAMHYAGSPDSGLGASATPVPEARFDDSAPWQGGGFAGAQFDALLF